MKDTPHGKGTLIESKEINDRKKINTKQSENEGHEQNQTKTIKGDDQKWWIIKKEQEQQNAFLFISETKLKKENIISSAHVWVH